MWSHYSDQHSGFVMELDHLEIGLKNDVVHSSYLSNADELAKPVIYSNNRSVGCYKTNRKDAIFMKSEQWCYEKEYRIAARLISSDLIKIKSSPIENLDEYIKKNIEYFNITEEEGDYSLFDINEDSPWPEESLKREALQFACHKLAKSNESLFLYQVPRKQ